MAARDTCAYDKLFTKSVPHIHEKIFFFLDYESFKNCKVVCKEWNDFLTSEPFQNKAQSVYFYKIKQEKYKLITYKTEIVANERKLFDCIKKGNAGEVNSLLSIGVDPKCERRQKGAYLGVLDMYRNPQAYTTLLLATEKGDTDLVKLLLDAGADPNSTPLYWASLSGPTPLHWASKNGEEDVVRLLLNAGAEPDRADTN